MRIITLIFSISLLSCYSRNIPIDPDPGPPSWVNRVIGEVVVEESGTSVIHEVGESERRCAEKARLAIAKSKGWVEYRSRKIATGNQYGDVIVIEKIVAGEIFGRPIDVDIFWHEVNSNRVHCLGISNQTGD